MSVRELCVCCVLGLRRSDHHHHTPHPVEDDAVLHRSSNSESSLNTFLSSFSSPPPPTIVAKKHRRFWTARPSKQASTRRTAPLAPASSEEPGRLLPPIHSFLPRSCHISLDPLLHDRTESQLHTSTPLQPHHSTNPWAVTFYARQLIYSLLLHRPVTSPRTRTTCRTPHPSTTP